MKGYTMEEDKIAFNKLLESAGLSKKRFAALARLSYGSVANWGGRDKSVPPWVRSWIDNYRKARVLESVEDVICKARK